MKDRLFAFISVHRDWSAFKIAGLYLMIGSLWIVFSDQVAGIIAGYPAIFTILSMFKGMGYIIITALLLYGLIRRHTAALRASEERLAFALEVSQIGAWELDLVDHTARRSLQHDRIFGYEALLPEWTYEMFLDHVLPEDRARVDHLFSQAIAARSDWNFECRIRRCDGKIRWIWAVGRHRRDHNNPLKIVGGIVQDITERKQADERFRLLVEASPSAIMLVNSDHRITLANARVEALFGYTREELIGQSIELLIPPDFRAQHDHYQATFFAAPQARSLGRERDIFGWRKDGSRVPLEIGLTPVTTSEGMFVLTTIIDITERKQAEAVLRESEERVRRKLDSILSPEGDIGNLELADLIDVRAIQSLMDNFYTLAHIPMSIIDLKGRVLVGVGWQQICTRFHRVHPETCEHCLESDTQLSRDIPPGEFKLYKCRNNMWDIATPIVVGGQHVGSLFSGQFFFEDEPLDEELFRSQARQYGFDEAAYMAALEQVPRLSRDAVDNGIAFLMKLAHMISLLSYSNIKLARSLAERDTLMDSLRQSEERYRSLFQNNHSVMLLMDPQTGDIINANPAACAFYGYTHAQITGLKISDINQLSRDEVFAEMERAKQEQRRQFFFRHRLASGEEREVEVFSGPIEFQGKKLLYSIIHDITERRQAEAALRAGEQRLRAIFDNAGVGIVEVDTEESRFIAANNRVLEILGYRREELLGITVHDLTAPEDWDRSDKMNMELIKGQRDRFDYEKRYLKRDSSPCWVHVTVSAVRDAGGEYLRSIATIEDISERKQAEETIRQLNQELEQRVVERTAQLEATNKELEAFAYSVSHDLRAPLRGIDGFSQALLEDYADKLDNEGQNYLRRVRAASQRMGHLIDDLLALSRLTRSEMRRERINLSELAQVVAEELRQAEPDRPVEFVIAGDIVAQGDAQLIRVALENLFGNAWKFTAKRPSARIEFGTIAHNSRPAYFVRDDGAGFDMAYADRLFGPFQRLHTPAEFAGTGIGLATVQRIIHRHGGEVWAEGAVEQGATFYFTL